MSEFQRAKVRIRPSSGESVRIMRALQVLSENQPAEAAIIPQSTIYAIETEQIAIVAEMGFE